MSDNVAVNCPDVEFIRPCNLCPHMKRNSLAKILTALQTLQPEVTIEPELAGRARAAVARMLAVRT
jgi:quinolinate synthase